jgi:hypothetical protein
MNKRKDESGFAGVTALLGYHGAHVANWPLAAEDVEAVRRLFLDSFVVSLRGARRRSRVTDGRVRPAVDFVLSFDQAKKAADRLRSNQSRGRSPFRWSRLVSVRAHPMRPQQR